MISLFAVILFVFIQQKEASASELVIMPKHDSVPIYDNRDDMLTEMGYMRVGEPILAVKSYSEDWWQVKFANAFGYIDKNDVQLQQNVKIPAKNMEQNSNTAILIHKDTDIYDNSTGKLKSFAVAKEGFRYPVISNEGNWWKVDAAGRTGFIHKSSATLDEGIRVLMYHHMLTPKEKADSPFAKRNTTTTTVEFNQQMDYLKDNGFTTISTKDLEGYLNGQINLPARSIVITIDDGNISSRIYAYPKLKQLGFIAEQYIITARTPAIPQTFNHKRLHFLSKQEMDEMADVYNYYAHTHNLHTLTPNNISFVIANKREDVKKDLLLNRQLLNNTTYFAYPFGQYTNDTVNLVREVGFTMAYTTKRGYATLGVNKLLIPRLGVEPNLPIKEFAKMIDTGMPAKTPSKPKPVPKPEPEQDGVFSDVDKRDGFYEAVLSLTERGIISGYPDGSFKPHNEVTRGQAAKILAQTLKLDLDNYVATPFNDVPETHQYYKPIAALVSAGVINGYEDGTFRPENKLTRAQMAKIITLGFQLEEVTLTNTQFTDVNESDAFSGYVQSLLSHNITTGTTPTTFSPHTFVKRQQLTLFVTRSEAAVENRQLGQK